MLTNWKTYYYKDGHMQAICRFTTIPITISAGFFVALGKLILKFIMKLQGAPNSQNNLAKEQFQNLLKSNSNQGRVQA